MREGLARQGLGLELVRHERQRADGYFKSINIGFYGSASAMKW